MSNLDFSDASKLQRRDGGEFRIYATDHRGDWPIVGAILRDGYWQIESWSLTGRRYKDKQTGFDLIPKPTRVTGWVNVYEAGLGGLVAKDRESAIEHRSAKCIGQIYIDAEVQT